MVHGRKSSEPHPHPGKFSNFSIPEKVLECTISINDKKKIQQFLLKKTKKQNLVYPRLILNLLCGGVWP